MEKVAKKCIFRKAGYAIRTRLCSPNTLFCVRASAGKMIKKASQKLLKIVQKSSKSACRAYQEFMQKKLRRKTQKMSKSDEKRPQKCLPLSRGKVSKISQNHENLVTQNQENPGKLQEMTLSIQYSGDDSIDPPPCRQARQGVFGPVSDGLIVGICF